MLVEILEVLLFFLIFLMLIYLIRHYVFTLCVLWKIEKNIQRSFQKDAAYQPTVSILIPARNEERVIGRILQRMTELTYPKDKLQVIVIDDGSSDATGEIAESYAKNYKYITVLRRSSAEGGRGKASALNFGGRRAKGEIILLFDADYYPQKDIVEKLVKAFVDPEVGAVQGRVVVLNEPKNLVTRIVALERIGGYRVDQQARENLGLIAQFGGTVGGIRRSLLESLGGWDENILAEDTDITFRIYLAGYKVRYVMDAESYEEAVESWRAYWRQRYRWAKGHMQCAFKHFLSVLKSKNLRFPEKIDALLLLNVYFLPVIVLFSWILSSILLFLKTPLSTPSMMLISIILYSSAGNFAPFFEVAVGGYLDGRTRACWILPLFLLTSLYNILICTKALLDLMMSKLRGEHDNRWIKTMHNGYGNFYIMKAGRNK